MKKAVDIAKLIKLLLVASVLYSIVAAVSFNVWALTPPEPVVAIHVSEVTHLLETTVATPPTPVPPADATGFEWWLTSWHYFVGYESLKEALRSDGTPFIEVTDADITAGNLSNSDGSPKYPILFTLASEAIRDDEIAPLRAYVNAGGILFIGSSALTRNPGGTTRGDFALGNEMGLHMVTPSLTNWYENMMFSKVADHRLIDGIPAGSLNWRMPLWSEQIPTGIWPDYNVNGINDVFHVRADSGTTVIADGGQGPLLATRQYGKGNFIYHGPSQPLLGYGGNDPGMYAYLIYRHAVEWAFEAADLPIIKLSPWRYAYNAAFIVRHDLDNDQSKILSIGASATFEQSQGAKGDYYFCTGTLRSEMTGTFKSGAIAGLRSAVTNSATIGSYNGGFKNPVNPLLSVSDANYWHWGPDEALDVTSFPSTTYTNGKVYAQDSILISYQDIEGWVSGLANGRSGCVAGTNCPRIWASPYFNSTRENSYDLLNNLGVKSAGEQKISPFPHWTLSTQTAGMHYPHVTLPLSDWYVDSGMSSNGGAIDAQSSGTVHGIVDFYYNLGALTNIYGHINSTVGNIMGDYVTYAAGKDQMWATNAVGIYDWWTVRSNVVTTPSYTITGNTATAQVAITGATDADTSVEFTIPPNGNFQQVLIDGTPSADHRTFGNAIKVHVGASASTAAVVYTIDNPVPTTTSLSPASAKAGGPGFTLTVNGTNFVSDSVVRWNGSDKTTAYVSSTQLTAEILAADIASAGTPSVTVSNPAPNGGLSNSQAFTVDGTAPTAAITYLPIGSYKSGATVTITATFSEPMADSPVPQIAISGANTLAATNMTKVSTTVYTYIYTVGSGNGTANVVLSAGTDVVGNVVTGTPTSGGTFTVDNTPPTAAITYSPIGSYKSGATVTITATFSEPMADSPVPQIAISGANTLAATNMTKVSTTIYTYTYTVGSGNGTANVVLSTGTDVGGNVVTGTPTSGGTFTVDNTAPDTSITSQPTNPSNQASASFSFTATEAGSTFECQIDSGVYTSCTSTKTYSGLASGQTHTFNVRATDPVGNRDLTPATYSWLIDTALPNPPSVTGTTPTNDTTPTWTWSSGGGGGNGNFRFKLDNSDLATGATPITGTSYTATTQTQGTHTLYVQEQNAVGNWSGSGSFSIVIDTTAPTLAISASSPSVGNSATPVTYTVTYTGADTVTLAVGDVTVNKTGTANGSVEVTGSGSTRTVTISGITGNGTLGISIAAGTASDLAGNTAAAAGPGATFTVDNSSGDLDGSGVVDVADALKALRFAAGLDSPTALDIAHADVAPLVNGIPHPDGTIDITDVVVILRKAVGLSSY